MEYLVPKPDKAHLHEAATCSLIQMCDQYVGAQEASKAWALEATETWALEADETSALQASEMWAIQANVRLFPILKKYQKTVDMCDSQSAKKKLDQESWKFKLFAVQFS